MCIQYTGSAAVTVVIDGYTVSSTHKSPATLPLGTTLILVCRLSGIPHGQQTTYTWTCPNTPCQQTGYAGRKINNNIIAINTTSTSDGGTYTCTVTAGGMEASHQFQLNIVGKCIRANKCLYTVSMGTQKYTNIPFIRCTLGGAVVHSYGRLIFHERVITDRHQLQPPNNDTGDGRIECTVSSGQAEFNYIDQNSQPIRSEVLIEKKIGAKAIFKIKSLNNLMNFEGSCGGVKHYVYLTKGEACILYECMGYMY